MYDIDMDIDFFKKMRVLQGLSRTEIALRSGLSQAAISKLEKKSVRILSEENLQKVCRALGLVCEDERSFFENDLFMKIYLPEEIISLMVDYSGVYLILDVLLNVMGSHHVNFYAYIQTDRFVLDRLVFGDPVQAIIINDTDHNIMVLVRRKLLGGHLPAMNALTNVLQMKYANHPGFVVSPNLRGGDPLRNPKIERGEIEALINPNHRE